jgi:hypothetical protein
MMRDDLENVVLKNRVLSQNSTFKTAFNATMGYYAAQFVGTLLGLATIALILGAVMLGYKLLG